MSEPSQSEAEGQRSAAKKRRRSSYEDTVWCYFDDNSVFIPPENRGQNAVKEQLTCCKHCIASFEKYALLTSEDEKLRYAGVKDAREIHLVRRDNVRNARNHLRVCKACPDEVKRQMEILKQKIPSEARAIPAPVAIGFSSSQSGRWSYGKPCTRMEWSSLVKASLSVHELSFEPANPICTASASADLVLLGVVAAPKADATEETEQSQPDLEPIRLTGVAELYDIEVGGELSDLIKETAESFEKVSGTGFISPTLRVTTPGSKYQRCILVGLGAGSGRDDGAITGLTLGKIIADKCDSETKVKFCHVFLPHYIASSPATVKDIATGFYEHLYADSRYHTGSRSREPVAHLHQVKIWSQDLKANAANAAVAQGRKLAEGVILSKDIVNSPHNVLNSLSLAETARRIAEQSKGRISCAILGKRECETQRMGAFLAAARGCDTDPQFIHLIYTPPPSTTGKEVRKVGIVGKGLLFDTGGYSNKTHHKIKSDRGGSAAVLGAALAISAIEPIDVEAHFIVASCENMVNGTALVPSDILMASNGLTIEVTNTDAEGRLTLVDALVYCDKEVGCESILELSTLTCECLVALGEETSGIWTRDEDLAREIYEISNATGEKTWRMPLPKMNGKLMGSKTADLKSYATKNGGATDAACLLQNFVSKNKPFAHIDMFGPVWDDEIGATGYGTKLVAEWVRRQGLKAAIKQHLLLASLGVPDPSQQATI